MIRHVYIQHNSSVKKKKNSFKNLKLFSKFFVGISSWLRYSLILLSSVRRSNFGQSSCHISFAESQPASFVIVFRNSSCQHVLESQDNYFLREFRESCDHVVHVIFTSIFCNKPKISRIHGSRAAFHC